LRKTLIFLPITQTLVFQPRQLLLLLLQARVEAVAI
jgi:hypothetical protein